MILMVRTPFSYREQGMKRLIIAILILTMNTVGCANHFYRVKENSVRIYIVKPEAHTVLFAYSKDGYQLHPAEKIDAKTWAVTVQKDLEFSYFYLVDGAVFVPSCKFKENDDFGSENSIFSPAM